jgi:hypothetical protein
MANLADISELSWEAGGPAYLRLLWDDPKDRPMFSADVVGALWSVELMHDFSILLAHPAYQETDLSDPGAFFAQGWQLVRPEHRLQVVSVRHGSPLAFIVLIPAAAAGIGAVWVLTQTVEKIANFRLNREKLKFDVAKAKADVRKSEAEADAAEYDKFVSQRKAEATAEQLQVQVGAGSMQLVEGELTSDRPAA